MLISLIIPVYGVEKYIGQLLDSIKAQTWKDIEVIFVDDGSPDNCPAILDDFVMKDERYKVIHQANAGVAMARNEGLKYATGEYVYIIDSDDWLEPNTLEMLGNCALKTNADVIYTDVIWEYENRSQYVKRFEKNFFSTDTEVIAKIQKSILLPIRNTAITDPVFGRILYASGAPWSILIRREVIGENYLCFDPYVKGVGDDILFSLAVFEYVKSVAYVMGSIYHFRQTEISYTRGYAPDLLEKHNRVFKRFQEFIKRYDKDESFINLLHFRMFSYMNSTMPRYFLNTQSSKTKRECYAEMVKVFSGEPYKSAIKDAPLYLVAGFKDRLKFIAVKTLLRMKLFKLYWNLSKLHLRMKKARR